jgi:hypothetical protein
MNKKITIPTIALMAVLGFSAHASAVAVTTSVSTAPTAVAVSAKAQADMKAKAEASDTNHKTVFGTVTAVTGSTITVQSKDVSKTGAAPVSYTVNASTAVVDKNTAASTIASVVVGDNVMVEGTISGTTITATKIHNGVMAKGVMANNGDKNIPEGNGQPIIGGTVTAVSGTTITIANKSNVSYTIDASTAKITKNGTNSAASTISVGDTVLAQGTVNGTAVAASSIIVNTGGTSQNAEVKGHVGFFAKIGGFFARLFGMNK